MSRSYYRHNTVQCAWDVDAGWRYRFTRELRKKTASVNRVRRNRYIPDGSAFKRFFSTGTGDCGSVRYIPAPPPKSIGGLRVRGIWKASEVSHPGGKKIASREVLAREAKRREAKKFRERLRNPVEAEDAGYDAERYLDENEAWETDK